MPEIPEIALSVRQPWAWAIVHGGKDVENRVKRAITMGGMKPGRIAVHAAKGMTRDEYDGAARFMAKLGLDVPRPDELRRGGIIGTVTVTGHVKESDSPWFFGPWALTLEDASECRHVACSGALGYFRWQPDVEAEFDAPKPWMIAWPEGGRKPKVVAEQKPAPAPLFETNT